MNGLLNRFLSIHKYFSHQKLKSLLRDIGEAISGSERDYTTGNLNKAIVLLAVPMVLEVALESVFALVDIFFVSRINPDAVATVGITESMLTIIYAIGIGFSMGTTALIARRTGEKNADGAASAAVQSIIFGIAISLVLAVPGIFYAKDLLRLMGASEVIVNEYSLYTSITIGGNMVVILLFVINAVFRSAGDAALSMKILWLANIMNIILDPLLIFGWGPIPALGIKGAAIASVAGRGTAVALQFYLLYKGVGRNKIQKRHLKLEFPVLWQLIRLSIGGIGQYLVATASWVVLMKIMNGFGSAAVAGYTIAIRLFIFTLMPAWGLGNAAATLVGQNLGAGQPGRAQVSVERTALINTFYMIFCGVVFFSMPGFFMALFTDDAAVINVGSTALRIISFGYVSYGLGLIIPQVFNGAGDTATPTLINLLSYWLIQIPMAYLLAVQLGWAEKGVFYSIIVAETVMAVTSVLLFRRGRWKLKKV